MTDLTTDYIGPWQDDRNTATRPTNACPYSEPSTTSGIAFRAYAKTTVTIKRYCAVLKELAR